MVVLLYITFVEYIYGVASLDVIELCTIVMAYIVAALCSDILSNVHFSS